MIKNLDYRYKRQELFDITRKDLIPFVFEDKERLVYSNVNLSIFLTDYCNAGCNFCVAKLRYLVDKNEYLKPSIKEDDFYYERLEYVLKTVSPLNPSVSLTGGEPTYSHRIKKVIELLDKYNIRKRTITTNGTFLFKEIEGDTILDLLINNNFKHLNISRAHYDEDLNFAIMNCNEKLDLQRIMERVKNTDLRVRLSCVLLDSGIRTIPDMKNYMSFAERYNIDNVVFRELMNYDESSVDSKNVVHNYCKSNRMYLQNIWEQIDNDKDFKFENQVLGYYYYVEVYKYKNIDMVSESANIANIKKEKQISLSKTHGIPVVYEMVFHPNGFLNGSWREWEDYLLTY